MSRDDLSTCPTPSQTDASPRKKSKKRPRDEAAKQTLTPVKRQKSSSSEKKGSDSNDTSVRREKARSARLGNGTASSDRQSPFHKERVSLYLTLTPIAYSCPLEGAIAEHISPLLLTYFAPLDGIIVSFDNATLSTRPAADTADGSSDGRLLGQSLDEYAVTFVWLTADFLVFRPREGTVVEGVVNLQNQSTLGLLCYNYFNASIPRTHLPSEWEWVEHDDAADESDGGHFVDGDGNKVGGLLSFRVKGFDTSNNDGVGTVNVHGTLLANDSEGGGSK